jgi:hypothetical protein
MMRGVVRSLFVVAFLLFGLGGMAFAGDPMPAEQAADPKPADSKFETVKRDAPTEGATPAASTKHVKKSKHKKSHQARKARKHKKSHHKTKAK